MNIAIVGATGLVGRKILKTLCERGLIKNNKIFLYASKKSNNKKIKINDNTFKVRELCNKNLINNYDFALFSAGKNISKNWAHEFVKRGATVIDNSSAFRRDKKIPLVVPEINAEEIKSNKIIANPNCSTIGISIPLYELSKMYKIKRVIVSTYQAVSGAGQKGISSLKSRKFNAFNYEIKNNLIPQIDSCLDNGYTFEEDKMDFELKKILNNKNLKISATCVRVPIENCHSESVYVEFFEKPDIEIIREKLKSANGINLIDDLKNNKYPMPIIADGQNDILVGRIRADKANKNAISFFLTFDNVSKGAGVNAVQIMEYLINER